MRRVLGVLALLPAVYGVAFALATFFSRRDPGADVSNGTSHTKV